MQDTGLHHAIFRTSAFIACLTSTQLPMGDPQFLHDMTVSLEPISNSPEEDNDRSAAVGYAMQMEVLRRGAISRCGDEMMQQRFYEAASAVPIIKSAGVLHLDALRAAGASDELNSAFVGHSARHRARRQLGGSTRLDFAAVLKLPTTNSLSAWAHAMARERLAATEAAAAKSAAASSPAPKASDRATSEFWRRPLAQVPPRMQREATPIHQTSGRKRCD
jgi:hypothetical protein